MNILLITLLSRKKKKTNNKKANFEHVSDVHWLLVLSPLAMSRCPVHPPNCITRTQILQSCFYISVLHKCHGTRWEKSSSPSSSNGLVKMRLGQLQSSCDDLQQILLSLILQHKEKKNLHIGQFFPTY